MEIKPVHDSICICIRDCTVAELGHIPMSRPDRNIPLSSPRPKFVVPEERMSRADQKVLAKNRTARTGFLAWISGSIA